MNSNFLFHGGNSLLALTFIEQIKQSYLSIDPNYLFDLVLHKTFKDLIEYLNNPTQQKQSIEYFSSNLSTNSIMESNLNPISSIQRCSKINLHHQNIGHFRLDPRILRNNCPNLLHRQECQGRPQLMILVCKGWTV